MIIIFLNNIFIDRMLENVNVSAFNRNESYTNRFTVPTRLRSLSFILSYGHLF